MNLVDFLSKNYEGKIIVLTTKNNPNNKLSVYRNESSNIIIKRMRFSGSNLFFRLTEYFFFYLESLFSLFRYNAKTVLYFESISAWSALIYKRIKGKKTNLMVHYHEYIDPAISEEESSLSKWMHKMEKRMYPRFSWISHTNGVRLTMFKDDNNLNHLPASIFHVVPNYPSRSWMIGSNNNCLNEKVKKLVFVGSLGYDNMYLQELVEWLKVHEEEFTLDVYSYNIDEKSKLLLINSYLKNVRYCDGCNYDELPEVLKNYHIGLDIYKPYALNHIHGVSNKVFEYLACGLDVWFSTDKHQTLEYIKKDIYPKLVPVNFNQMDSFDYSSAITREGLHYEPSVFFYENIYPEIMAHISNNNGETRI